MKLVLESKIENEYGISRVFTNVQTNADRIRSMTDEELVEFLAPYNSGCPKEHGSVMACHELGCYKCWSIWLKKEVSE